MDHIISFCASCGVMLPAGMGCLDKDAQKCENCGHSVSNSNERIDGTFSREDAHRLFATQGMEGVCKCPA